jgi:hypothetical protein
MTIHDPTFLPSSSTAAAANKGEPGREGAKSPAAAAKKKKAAGKQPKGLGQTATKKKKRRDKTESYATFVHRVLKQVHPEAGISKKAMVVMGTYVTSVRVASGCMRHAPPQSTHTHTQLTRTHFSSSFLYLYLLLLLLLLLLLFVF